MKKYIQLSERLATILPTAYFTDSWVVQAYYRYCYRSEPPNIPYGSEIEHLPTGEYLDRYNLAPKSYVLFVGIFVPENCVHHLVEAFMKCDTVLNCVIVGDSAYSKEYIDSLKNTAGTDPRIIFTGYVFGKGYHELGSNSLIFVETSGVGGTHPALVEAMAFENCVITHNTPENLETIGNAGFSYDGTKGSRTLQRTLEKLLAQPDLVKEYRDKAKLRAQQYYSWEAVADSYERLFYKLLRRLPPDRLWSSDDSNNY